MLGTILSKWPQASSSQSMITKLSRLQEVWLYSLPLSENPYQKAPPWVILESRKGW